MCKRSRILRIPNQDYKIKVGSTNPKVFKSFYIDMNSWVIPVDFVSSLTFNGRIRAIIQKEIARYKHEFLHDRFICSVELTERFQEEYGKTSYMKMSFNFFVKHGVTYDDIIASKIPQDIINIVSTTISEKTCLLVSAEKVTFADVA